MKNKFLILSCLLLVLVACEKNNNNNSVYQDILAPNTKIIDNSLNQNITSIDENSITFTGSSNEIESISTGDILVSDISSNAPAGYLRKVVDIQKNGDETKIITEQATIVDAVQEGSFSLNTSFNADDIIVDTSGIDFTKKSGKITIMLNNVVYDDDGNNSTELDQVKILGSIELTASDVIFEMDIRDFSVEKFNFEMTNNITSNLTLQVGGNVGSISEELIIKSLKLAPFVIPGPIPIPVAEQYLIISIGAEGAISSTITGGVTNNTTLKSSLLFEDEEWNASEDITNNFSEAHINVNSSLSAGVFFKTKYEIRPFGLRDSRCNLGAKTSLDALASKSGMETNWSLSWGVSLDAQAEMNIFDENILSYENDFFSWDYPISDGTNTGGFNGGEWLVMAEGTQGCNDPNSNEYWYAVDSTGIMYYGSNDLYHINYLKFEGLDTIRYIEYETYDVTGSPMTSTLETVFTYTITNGSNATICTEDSGQLECFNGTIEIVNGNLTMEIIDYSEGCNLKFEAIEN